MKKQLKSYGIITLGSVIFALAFDVFFAANQVAMGGITGLAQVINALVPGLSVGTLAFVLNIPLFLAGWKFIGWHLLVSIISMLLQSMFGYVIGQTVNMFLSLALTLYIETTLCCFYLLLTNPDQIGVRRVDPTSMPGYQQPPQDDELN